MTLYAVCICAKQPQSHPPTNSTSHHGCSILLTQQTANPRRVGAEQRQLPKHMARKHTQRLHSPIIDSDTQCRPHPVPVLTVFLPKAWQSYIGTLVFYSCEHSSR